MIEANSVVRLIILATETTQCGSSKPLYERRALIAKRMQASACGIPLVHVAAALLCAAHCHCSEAGAESKCYSFSLRQHHDVRLQNCQCNAASDGDDSDESHIMMMMQKRLKS
jgi:hypothetical protein